MESIQTYLTQEILLNGKYTKKEKEQKLKELKSNINNNIEQALKYLEDYTYCDQCNDWYRTNSFERTTRTEKEEFRYCSAGEWDDDIVSYVEEPYIITICPKGHEKKQRYMDVIS